MGAMQLNSKEPKSPPSWVLQNIIYVPLDHRHHLDCAETRKIAADTSLQIGQKKKVGDVVLKFARVRITSGLQTQTFLLLVNPFK